LFCTTSVFAQPRLKFAELVFNSDISEAVIAAKLKGLGITGVQGAENAFVLLNDFSGLEKVPLLEYSSRVLPEDLRNDGYAQALLGFFERGGRHHMFIPIKGSQSAITAAVGTAFGSTRSGHYTLYGLKSKKPNLTPLLFAVGILFILFLIFSQRRRVANLARTAGRVKTRFDTASAFEPVPILPGEGYFNQKKSMKSRILRLFGISAACAVFILSFLCLVPQASVAAGGGTESGTESSAAIQALSPQAWERHAEFELNFPLRNLHNSKAKWQNYALGEDGLMHAVDGGKPVLPNSKEVPPYPYASLYAYLSSIVSK
jgi:hypothetical protein